ncbi:MAG: sortase [Candidatus Levybacteria bacterium]|nr:sortase [Candidatus Levybacteria bacterium]
MAIPPKNFKKASRQKQIITFLIVRTIGNFLVLFTLFGIGATFGPAGYFEVRYKVAELFDVKYSVVQEVNNGPSELGKLVLQERKEKTQPSLLDTVLSGQKEEILYPQDPAFSVIIPKIGANERIAANVSPDDEKEYLEVLRTSIAHAKGTAYPGLNGTTYLFAHSTDNFWNVGRYNAVFYLLNKMSPGDDVVLYFNNKRHNYTVTETKIVDDSDTHYIDSALGQGERVILQTCWPPGTAWKRLLVFATPK